MPGEWMEREILEQPETLRANAPRYAAELGDALAGKSYDAVVLVARGSSDNAALFARYLIEVHLGIPALLAAPSVLTRYGRRVRYPRCLGIGISQSGAAPDVSEVMGALREAGHATLAITNTPGSRVSDQAGTTLLLGVGEERSIAATKTYTASLLALGEVVRALGGPLPPLEMPDENWITEARKQAEFAVNIVGESTPVFALGRGFQYCTAHETALKLMECALLPCKAFSTADFEHGPKALAGRGSAAISFDGHLAGLHEQGCRIVTPVLPPVAEVSLPLHSVIFGQWLALDLARRRGLDPDRTGYLTKITETR